MDAIVPVARGDKASESDVQFGAIAKVELNRLIRPYDRQRPFFLLPFTCAPLIVPPSVVVPVGVGMVKLKLAVNELLEAVQEPVATVTVMNWLMISGTPTVKVEFRPLLAKATLFTDSVKVTEDAN